MPASNCGCSSPTSATCSTNHPTTGHGCPGLGLTCDGSERTTLYVKRKNDEVVPLTLRQRQMSSSASSSIKQQTSGLKAFLRNIAFSSPQFLLDSLKVIFPTAIFFLKFLEWWYSPSSPARSLSTSPSGPAIPPPRLLPPHPKGLPVDPTKYGQCPICLGPIHNATALPSGYVFCFRCVHDHVEQHGRCPITLLPARIWQMRKILL